MAAGGDGVARAEGMVVFLPRTAPGDGGFARVTAGRSFGRGVMLRLDEPSPSRVEPRCVHYERDRCGGCQLQHMDYTAQLDAKRGIVADALARIAKVRIDVPPVEPSPEQWKYRSKLTLALRRRTAESEQMRGGLAPVSSPWTAGLHPFDTPGAVFPLEDCPITNEGVLGVWRSVLSQGSLLPEAAELRVAVRTTPSGASLVVEGGAAWLEAGRLAEAVPELAEIWWSREGDSASLLHGRLYDMVPGALRPDEGDEPGASFTQVNPEVASALRRYVLDLAMAAGPHTAVDAYAGTGAYASMLEGEGVRVTAIEQDEYAARFASGVLSSSARVIVARVEDALAAALPADVVIVNPPRRGLHERVSGQLAEAAVGTGRLIYVSCNPATLARDLTRLKGWRATSVRAFDMFPQTAHVEVVCELVSEVA